MRGFEDRIEPSPSRRSATETEFDSEICTQKSVLRVPPKMLANWELILLRKMGFYCSVKSPFFCPLPTLPSINYSNSPPSLLIYCSKTKKKKKKKTLSVFSLSLSLLPDSLCRSTGRTRVDSIRPRNCRPAFEARRLQASKPLAVSL